MLVGASIFVSATAWRTGLRLRLRDRTVPSMTIAEVRR
jgi:hypothetical protein